MPELIYLDHNATTPLLPEVIDAIRECHAAPYLNPASQHEFGRRARRKLEDARQRIAEILGAKTTGVDADQVIFTSGGTEANNLALRGLAEGGRRPFSSHAAEHPGQIILSTVEHPSITALADAMSATGWQVDRLGVDANGVIRLDQLRAFLRSDTRVVATMLGQNETGVLQPVAELAAIANEQGVPLHTDAAQVVGKLPVNFHALGVASLSAAAHKFHGPLGIGLLIVRHGVRLNPQLFGGFQQAGFRPGTESVALAVGMCRALQLWHAESTERASRMRALRDRFEQTILQGWPEALVQGHDVERLPHTSNIALVGLDRQALFMAIDQAGVACSTGSACASGSSEPSPALVAMGAERAVISSSLRFSLGANTTTDEVDEAARRILRCCNDLRPRKVY